MAYKAYIGDADGVARRIRKMYLGDADGIARLVRWGYLGDASGVARKFLSGEMLMAIVGTALVEINPDTGAIARTINSNATSQYVLAPKGYNEYSVSILSKQAVSVNLSTGAVITSANLPFTTTGIGTNMNMAASGSTLYYYLYGTSDRAATINPETLAVVTSGYISNVTDVVGGMDATQTAFFNARHWDEEDDYGAGFDVNRNLIGDYTDVSAAKAVWMESEGISPQWSTVGVAGLNSRLFVSEYYSYNANPSELKEVNPTTGAKLSTHVVTGVLNDIGGIKA